MNKINETAEAVLPTARDAALAAEASRVLATGEPDGDLRVHLLDGQELTLPNSVRQLMYHLLTEVAQGNAVTIIPIHAELTTQEAADFLNVSRPYLVRLLEDGEIPFHRVGTHRRVRFEDLKMFKELNRAARSKALDELAAQAQELGGMGY